MTDEVKVEQCDREAAAELIWPQTRGDVGKLKVWLAICSGNDDGHYMVQAFARHRLAALAAMQPRGEPQAEDPVPDTVAVPRTDLLGLRNWIALHPRHAPERASHWLTQIDAAIAADKGSSHAG